MCIYVTLITDFQEEGIKSPEVVAIVSAITHWEGKELASWDNICGEEGEVLLKDIRVNISPYNSANGESKQFKIILKR